MGFEALVLERCRAKGCPWREMWKPRVGGLPPNPPAQPQCQAGGAGERVPVCPWPAGLKPPLGGEAQSPNAVLGCNRGFPTAGWG